MVAPDLVGCLEHGPAEFVVYLWKNGRSEKRCLACSRNKNRKSRYPNGGDRCRRGHLKTPWSWRRYSGLWRCMACHNLKRAERKSA